MVDNSAPMEARFAVFRYYGSFSATLLTMFEARHGHDGMGAQHGSIWVVLLVAICSRTFSCLLGSKIVRMIRFDWPCKTWL